MKPRHLAGVIQRGEEDLRPHSFPPSPKTTDCALLLQHEKKEQTPESRLDCPRFCPPPPQASGSADPSVYDEPTSFCPMRFAGASPPPLPMAFGAGPHLCMGADYAILLSKVREMWARAGGRAHVGGEKMSHTGSARRAVHTRSALRGVVSHSRCAKPITFEQIALPLLLLLFLLCA